MKLLDNLFARWGYAKEVVSKTLAEEASAQPPAKKKSRNFIKPIFMKFKEFTGRNVDLVDPEFDFKTIRAAVDVESILRQAREKHLQLMWKNSYNFVGRNQKAVDYIKLRLMQIAMMNNTPTQVLLDQMSEELYTYHNCFIAVQRDAGSSSGTPYVNVFGKRVNPISGLFVLPASHIQPMRDAPTGRLVGWKVTDVKDESPKYFTADDVVHFYMSRSSGNLTGTPAVLPVLNDIRALRRIEQSAEALVYQHAIPLIQYQIGLKDDPEFDPAEFDDVRTRVEISNPQGIFVVPFHHNITAIGNGASPLDVHKYLSYFRLRVISGMGLSSVVFGESDSSNRGTSNVQDRGLQDSAKRYLTVLKTFFNDMILNELLREGGFDIMDIDHKVCLFTPEIDIDAKIKKETHVMGLFHGNCITEDEMRQELGRDPVDDDGRLKLYWTLVDLPKSIILTRDEALAGVLMNEYEEAHGKNIAGLKIDKKTANLIRPINQQGPKITSQPKANDQDVLGINARAEIKSLFDSMGMQVAEKLTSAKAPINIKDEVEKAVDSIYLYTTPSLKSIYIEGWKQENKETKDVEITMDGFYGVSQRYEKFLHDLANDATTLLEGLQTSKIALSGEEYKNSITYGDVANVFDVVRISLACGLPPVVESALKAGSTQARPPLQDAAKEKTDGPDLR